MLSKNQLVAVRTAIEKAYIGTCTIIEKQKIQKANKTTVFNDVIILENQPCKLSFSSIKSAQTLERSAIATQSVKVFISPEIKVKAGSKFTINQNGIIGEYASSGEPSMFATHQEINLESIKEWL